MTKLSFTSNGNTRTIDTDPIIVNAVQDTTDLSLYHITDERLEPLLASLHFAISLDKAYTGENQIKFDINGITIPMLKDSVGKNKTVPFTDPLSALTARDVRYDDNRVAIIPDNIKFVDATTELDGSPTLDNVLEAGNFGNNKNIAVLSDITGALTESALLGEDGKSGIIVSAGDGNGSMEITVNPASVALDAPMKTAWQDALGVTDGSGSTSAITFPDMSQYTALPNVPAFTLPEGDSKALFTAPSDCFVSVYIASPSTANFKVYLTDSVDSADSADSIAVGRGAMRTANLWAYSNGTVYMREGQVLYVNCYITGDQFFNAVEISYCPLLGNTSIPPKDPNADYVKNRGGFLSGGVYSSKSAAQTAATEPGLVAFYTEGS